MKMQSENSFVNTILKQYQTVPAIPQLIRQKKKNLADIVNFHAVKIIAQIGKEKNCRFIRILTDLAFGLKQRTILLP